jgi:acyl-CoA synthetase (AMP-forming)/AMP-acid ligase II
MPTGVLYEWLAQTAKEFSREKAITFVKPRATEAVTYTYQSLFERVEQLSTKLAGRYDDRGAPLGLLLSSREDQVLHYLAALAAGLVPAILPPPNRKLSLEYYELTMSEVLSRCGFGALVTSLGGLDFEGVQMAPHRFEIKPSIGSSQGARSAEDPVIDASFMQFSSGTTGIKKGVLVTDQAVVAQLRAYSEALGLDHSDCIVSWLPLYHDMGFIACLNMPLAFGVHTVMIDPIDWVSDPAMFIRTVDGYRGTLSWNPNFAYAFMAKRIRDKDIKGTSLASIRGLVNCSEPVTYESQDAFSKRFRGLRLDENVFMGCYAMAETTFALTHGGSDEPGYIDREGPTDQGRSPTKRRYVSVGRPLADVELRIRDSGGSEVPDREIGEIWVRSPFNFSRYFNDVDATSRSIVGDWYRTGDLGYRVDTAMYVVGRVKDLMIVAGVNVFPQEVEETVSQVNGVHPGRVSAFSFFDESLQSEKVVVVAESDRHDDAGRVEIVQEIRQRILAAFQIGNFEVVLVPPQWLIKSTSGKMARGANREKWRESILSA